MAWIFIPMTFEYETEHFRFNSWRLFTILCALPSLSVSFALIFLPESPRYLLTQGNEEGALGVFRYIYKINTGKSPSAFPVRKSLSDQIWVSFVISVE